jgi:hypothetical protein
MTLIKVYTLLRQHGAAFVRTPAGSVDVMLPEGLALPADLDAALIRQQRALADLAMFVEREPVEWSPGAATVELKAHHVRLVRKLADVPKHSREVVAARAKAIVDRGSTLIDRATRRESLQDLRLAAVAIEADIGAIIARVERQQGN